VTVLAVIVVHHVVLNACSDKPVGTIGAGFLCLFKESRHDIAGIQRRDEPLQLEFGILRRRCRAGNSHRIIPKAGRGQLCLHVAELHMVMSSARLHYNRLPAGAGLLRLRGSAKVHQPVSMQ